MTLKKSQNDKVACEPIARTRMGENCIAPPPLKGRVIVSITPRFMFFQSQFPPDLIFATPESPLQAKIFRVYGHFLRGERYERAAGAKHFG